VGCPVAGLRGFESVNVEAMERGYRMDTEVRQETR
jgi:hypothetical protein